MKMLMVLRVYFDGLCEPSNPGGVACYGVVVYDGSTRVYSEGKVVGAGMFGDDVTNNVAEYHGVIRGLEWLADKGMVDRKVVVFGDSMLVIKQLNGEYSVKSHRIVPLYDRAMVLAGSFFDLVFQWIPRSKNFEADALSRNAYEKFALSNFEFFQTYYRNVLLTKKQADFIRKLGGTPSPLMSKRDASKLIEDLVRKRAQRTLDSFG